MACRETAKNVMLYTEQWLVTFLCILEALDLNLDPDVACP